MVATRQSYPFMHSKHMLVSVCVNLKNVKNKFTSDQTYSSNNTPSLPGCNFNPRCMNFGPHQANAPVTKATQVNPSVDNMNDGFLAISMKFLKLITNFIY